MMIRSHLYLILSLIFTQGLLAQSVTDYSAVDPTDGVVVELIVENGGTHYFDIFEVTGSGTSESSPHTIYVPIRTTTTANHAYSYYSSKDKLPIHPTGAPQTSADLRFRLNVVTADGFDTLFFGRKDEDGKYRVVTAVALDGNGFVDISLTDICSDDRAIDCEPLEKEKSPQSVEEGIFHFFLGSNDTNVDDYNSNNGVYYKIKLSSRIFSSNEVDLIDLQKGDSQLIADFNGFSMGDNYQGLFAVQTNKGTNFCSGIVDPSQAETMDSLGKSIGDSDFINLETTLINGQKKLTGLENNNCYEMRFLQCDFFGFCSKASQSYQNTPEGIETLLKKQACFFFTAGFGRQHFIVDYFQEWRNKVLRKFWVGRAFVNWYYKTAPQYTPFILKTPWLQKVIQVVAYMLYGVIKFWWLFALLGVMQFWRKRFLLPNKS